MPPSKETSKLPPDPVEIVDAFNRAHHDLVRDALVAYASPTDETLLEVSGRLQVCREMVRPFADSLFFKKAPNQLVMSLAVGSVIGATTELVEKIRALNPNSEEISTFKPDVQPYLVFCISEDETIELPEELRTYVEAGEIPTPEQAALTTCNVYLGLLERFGNALFNSDNVSEYVLERNRIELERAEKTRVMKFYGGTAVAAFVGAYLANRLRRRK